MTSLFAVQLYLLNPAQKSGLSLPEGAVTAILKLHAHSGNSKAADDLVNVFISSYKQRCLDFECN